MASFLKFFVGIITVGFILPPSMGGPLPNDAHRRIRVLNYIMIAEFRRRLAQEEAEAEVAAAAREYRREDSSSESEESSDEDDRSPVLGTSDTEIDQ